LDQETELTQLQEAHYFIPAGGDSSGTVGYTTTSVSALAFPTPGSGTMQRYKLNPNTGLLYAYGDPVTVYSSVRVEVESGKYVQAKKIDGLWWLDVEDCKDEQDGI
jgi:hypothetical protein